MIAKLLILAGAPESRRLDWTTSGLLSTFQPAIAQFALLQPAASQRRPDSGQQQGKSALDLAVWRSLPLARTHVHTGFSQQHDLHFIGAFPSSADFLTSASISSSVASQGLSQEDAAEESNRLLTEFYEHSLAVHHDILSCQLVPGPQSQQRQPKDAQSAGEAGADTSFVSDTNSNSRSFTSDEGGDSTAAPAKTPLQPAPGRGADHLSDLDDIPPASYLLSIAPSTMTVTLIVGIISIAAPRTVETRYGATKTLVEVLVGDETKSGFSITFWLSGDAGAGVLAGLRSQDVVLMLNVALNVFRQQVYGGSLRRDLTRVHLLYRERRVDEEDVGGYYSQADLSRAGRGVGGGQQHPQLEKTRRVRDWVLKFVGGSVGCEAGSARATRNGKERAAPRDWNQPPPLDTQ